MMTATFVHLHVHTAYSLVDGLIRVAPLVEAAGAGGMPAVAVTEQSNLFSFVKFYRAALGAGIKPIVGADVLVYNDGDANRPHRLLLLCRDLEGYRQLARLVSRSYTDGQVRGSAVVHPDWLDAGATSALIALCGPYADIGQALLAGQTDEALHMLERWRKLFGDRIYLELHRTGRELEERYIDEAMALASAQGAPVVATNDVRFLKREDFEAHEARVCVHDGRVLDDPRRPRLYSDQQYLRDAQEMSALFADIPEALENSVEIARRCNIEIAFGRPVLPEFPAPGGHDVSVWFEEQSVAGLEQRLRYLFDPADQSFAERRQCYTERLQSELDVIVKMGFAGYFLIVADFINWAKANGVPVGPGRGSGAGSLVAYALGITELDPIAYDLLFERFLNPERVSLPDFDVDFCMEGRDRVIDYVTSRYGGNQYVSQIITFGTMAAKAVVRDVGRVLGHAYGFVDQIARLVPFELGMTLDKALEQEELLRRRYESEDEVRTLLDLARKLEGIPRNAGRHAGGVVIAPAPLTDFTALYCEQGAGSVVTQLDKDDVESVGLVKFDFLGLRTLTIIDRAVAAINRDSARHGEAALDINTIALDDPQTYALIQACATTAVFQLESRVMKDLIRRLQPANFDDVIALNALIRPGPSQLADDFIDRKHGRAPVAYLHPRLEPILKATYGVILYQEQVMQIAQVLAGYTLGSADLLRRAMGKKKPDEMAKQRAVFERGALERGVSRDAASRIFDLMEKFAGYGFNKSHSAAYALVAYQTAWLKTHYRAAFMAAVLSADMDNTDKVVTLIDECRDMDLAVLPPDVNECAYAFNAESVAAIRYGLGAIKGVGQSAIEGIIAERDDGGVFVDLFDFCRRVQGRRVNRRVVEALIRSGALDALGPTRAAMTSSLTRALQAAEQYVRDQSSGQDDLFGGASSDTVHGHAFDDVAEWRDEDRLAGEKETLGLYLTGHPIAQFEAELGGFIAARLVELRPDAGQEVRVAGLVVNIRSMMTRKGRMAVITLDDRSARMEAVLYSEVYQRCREMLAKDRLMIVEGEVSTDDLTGGCTLIVSQMYDLERAREMHAKLLLIRVDASRIGNGFVQELSSVLQAFREGPTPVSIEYRRAEAVGRLRMGQSWRVRPAQELLSRLRAFGDAARVEVRYS